MRFVYEGLDALAMGESSLGSKSKSGEAYCLLLNSTLGRICWKLTGMGISGKLCRSALDCLSLKLNFFFVDRSLAQRLKMTSLRGVSSGYVSKHLVRLDI